MASQIATSVQNDPTVVSSRAWIHGVAASLGWPPIVKLCQIHAVADPAARLVHYLLLTPIGMMDANRFNFELAYAFPELQPAGNLSCGIIAR
jgi:hypothetical protein